jgi:hypothetical protein
LRAQTGYIVESAGGAPVGRRKHEGELTMNALAKIAALTLASIFLFCGCRTSRLELAEDGKIMIAEEAPSRFEFFRTYVYETDGVVEIRGGVKEPVTNKFLRRGGSVQIRISDPQGEVLARQMVACHPPFDWNHLGEFRFRAELTTPLPAGSLIRLRYVR